MQSFRLLVCRCIFWPPATHSSIDTFSNNWCQPSSLSASATTSISHVQLGMILQTQGSVSDTMAQEAQTEFRPIIHVLI